VFLALDIINNKYVAIKRYAEICNSLVK